MPGPWRRPFWLGGGPAWDDFNLMRDASPLETFGLSPTMSVSCYFNLRRDARPLATIKVTQGSSAEVEFQSQTRCQAPGDHISVHIDPGVHTTVALFPRGIFPGIFPQTA